MTRGEDTILAQQLGLLWEFCLCWVNTRRLPYVAACWGDAIAETVFKGRMPYEDLDDQSLYCFSSPFNYVHIFVPRAPPWVISPPPRMLVKDYEENSFSFQRSHPARLRVIIFVPVNASAAARTSGRKMCILLNSPLHCGIAENHRWQPV
jgi:hypothetical protein